MCVIIVKEPGVTVPFDKLKSACIVNPDGWGAIVSDRGKAEVMRVFDPKGNSPDDIAKTLEQAKDLPLALHLRYATHGSKSVENCHPFDVMLPAKDGKHIVLMHNGTMSRFGGKVGDPRSDTAIFNETIVKRLVEDAVFRFGDEWNGDDFIAQVLGDYAGSNNKLVLFDEKGNHLIVNKSAGVQFPGYWASNDYSFNRHHREPSRYYSGSYGGSDYDDYDNDSKYYYGGASSYGTATRVGQSSTKTETSTKTSVPQVVALKPKLPQKDDAPWKLDGQEKEEMKMTVQDKIKKSAWGFDDGAYRQTFCDLAGIEDLMDLTKLGAKDILDLVNRYPEISAILIMDLLYELWMTDADA
jgi:hypothetical protein